VDVLAHLGPRAAGSEIALLKEQMAELTHKLEQKMTVDHQVLEIAMRLDARQVARDKAKRGPKGRQGERDARGERGLSGEQGPAGKPAADRPVITAFKVDVEHLLAICLTDSRGRCSTSIHFFQRFLAEVGGS
jgi:hypothetical protein